MLLCRVDRALPEKTIPMTSKDSSNRGSDARDIPSDINTHAVSLLRSRAAKIRTILDPGRLPTVHELMSGYPFFGDDLTRDLVSWCETSRHEKDCPAPVAIALQIVRDRQDLDSLAQAEGVLHDHGWQTTRLLIYRACLGDQPAAGELADHLDGGVTKAQVSFLGLIKHAIAVGLRTGAATCMDGALEVGIDDLHALSVNLNAWQKAERWFQQEAEPADQAELDALFLAAYDQAAEQPKPPAGEIVVPKLDDQGTSARRELIKSWKGLDGVPLPCVLRGDVGAQTAAIVDRWPHARDVIHQIMGDLSSRETIRFRPTLLVGPPGCGKSSVLRAISDTVGLPAELMPLGGVHDAAAMGTSAQWASARENAVLQLIKRSKMATVAFIWDEVEKVGTSKANGNILDALLALLEPDQARRYRDLALEVEVDLSMVTHFATANSLDDVPGPLKDRFRIIRMPDPGWQHLGSLTRNIINDLAKERGLDDRWYPPLAEDEMDLIRRAWPGGSIRQLTKIVRAVVDVRDAHMGRA